DADDGAFAARGWRLKPPLQVARGWRLKPPLWVGGWGESRALRRTLLAQADRILDELGLGALAESSDLLQAGLDARLARYAEALATALAELERSAPARSSLKQSTQQGSTQEGSTQQGSSHQGSTQEGSTHQGSPLERAEAAAERVLAHRQTASWPLRRERLRMSLRLLRWLARPEPAVGDFATAAESYAADGAFVDWARMTLLGGEELASLSAAYAALVGAVRTRRESFNRRFAGYLVEWNRAGGGRPGLVPVEGIIEALLAPLAARTPMLLLVADGMSLPLFRALTESLNALGWTEAAPLEGPRPVAGVAVLPTLTEGSRTSLLCGRLTLGTAALERSCFGTHPALTAVSRPDARPLIFHKADLGDGGGLAERVREAIRAPDQKLVCVVYNAVDDHLSGSDQLHLTWTVDDLRLLGPLLHEAGLAGRALLITADHGHVLEDGTTQRGREGNARWRVGTQPLDDEIALRGGRVLASAGVEQVILPWSEQVRYASKRNGYHGGATPQEVLTPLAVLLPPVAQALAGWRAVPPIVPEWWESSSVAPPISSGPEPAMVQAPRAGRRRKTAPGQDDLFATQTPAPAPSEPPWLDALLASPVYAAQKRLAARMAPTDDDLRRFLLALDSRGGKLGKSALAQRLGLPMIRIEGFLSLARRVLNVDRAAVIAVDSTTGTVELNLPLLRLQFQLETD
ncbi:MAG: BREX-2 system phosphatase PglZ, partial [Sphingobacteriia bacterium]|nr:BREX-2 system phosphatase PglZ [Sphingobacteriia bacterium]